MESKCRKRVKQQGHQTGAALLENNPLISKGFSNQKQTAPAEFYEIGERIFHDRFGEGTITEIVDKGSDFKLTIEFDSGMVRKMMSSFAKLKKL